MPQDSHVKRYLRTYPAWNLVPISAHAAFPYASQIGGYIPFHDRVNAVNFKFCRRSQSIRLRLYHALDLNLARSTANTCWVNCIHSIADRDDLDNLQATNLSNSLPTAWQNVLLCEKCGEKICNYPNNNNERHYDDHLFANTLLAMCRLPHPNCITIF